MAWFAALLALGWWLVAARLGLARRRVERLDAVPPDRTGLPSLSVVVAAANEQEHIRQAASTLLALDYPGLEVVVVDDRSTDATGAILDELAARDPRLTVMHVKELPTGWLGKTHALQCGANRARGDLILFTDADVYFHPEALLRAVQVMRHKGLDHLVAAPWLQAESFWEVTFLVCFNTLFQLRFQPDRVSDPRDRSYLGVGAFNLLWKEVYRKIGGHEPVALDVTDDMGLGRILKRSGFRTGVVDSAGLVRVRWVAGLTGAVSGLEKNAYAGVDYKLSTVFLTSAVILPTCLAPPLLLLASGWAQALGSLACLGMLATGSQSGPMIGVPAWGGLFFPLTGPLFAYIVARSAWLTEWRGGVVWRGTFYPLAELRAFARARGPL